MSTRSDHAKATSVAPSQAKPSASAARSVFISIDELNPAPAQGLAVLRLGLRPMYLAAMIGGLSMIVAWLAQLSGLLPMHALGLSWHGHEMIFGFAVPVILGFLFTATGNWTGLPMPRSTLLAGFVAIWLTGRLLMALGATLFAGLADLLLLGAAATVIGRALIRARQTRNLFVIAVLAGLALMHTGWLLATLAAEPGLGLGAWVDQALAPALLAAAELPPLFWLHAMLAIIGMLLTVFSGRVIPGFTANSLRRRALDAQPPSDLAAKPAAADLPTPRPGRDRLLNGCTGLALALMLYVETLTLDAESESQAMLVVAATGVALLAAGLHLWRWLAWRPARCLHDPLVWSLHLGALWLALTLLLVAAAIAQVVPMSAPVHALAVGAMAGLIAAMTTRSALGHTGRPLQATRADTVVYCAFAVAAALRVAPNLGLQPWHDVLVDSSALAFALGTLAFVWRYGPILTQPRADGRDG